MSPTFAVFRFWKTLIACATLLSFAFYAYAQPTNGHLLDKMELISGETESYLNIRGTFNVDMFQNITVTQGSVAEEVLVEIPGGFINNNLLQAGTLSGFPEGSALKSVDLKERIRQTDSGDVDFLVDLTLQSTQGLTVAVDRSKSNAQQLTLVLRGKKTKPRQVAEAPAPISPSVVSTSVVPASMTLPDQPSTRDAVLLHPVTAMLMYQQPLSLNVSVLNASVTANSAQRLAILLSRHQRRALEERVGMKLQLNNISSVEEQLILPKTKIYFRPNFFKAALTLAEIIPGEQVVEKMPASRMGKLGVDIEIYVGENFE